MSTKPSKIAWALWDPFDWTFYASLSDTAARDIFWCFLCVILGVIYATGSLSTCSGLLKPTETSKTPMETRKIPTRLRVVRDVQWFHCGSS